MIPRRALTIPLLLLGTVVACAGNDDATSDPAAAPSLAGDWRAVLTSPGGELPFTLTVAEDGDTLSAVVRNGSEEVPFSSVEQDGSRVVFHFTWYDSEITADLDESGDQMQGRWRRTSPGGTESVLPFTASRGDTQRFLPAADGDGDSSPDSIAGHWQVEFSDEDGQEPARGEFVQEGTVVTGTFLTPVGDYRFLDGTYEQGQLRLSTFDGAHAFLFSAEAREDGTLEGDFWSRDTYHATWTAKPIAEDESFLPDAWALAGLTNDDGDFRFAFPGLDGQTLSSENSRFDDKVVLVNIFGTWCPNCNDEAPFLAAWHERYRERGLEIVGLAYEFSGDPERDRTMLRRFAERYGIEYPLLLAGTSDKQAAGETLPDLTAVISYPTTIFIGRDGKVRKIHSGFNGPGTGDHHDRLIAELEGMIEELLDEPAKA